MIRITSYLPNFTSCIPQQFNDVSPLNSIKQKPKIAKNSAPKILLKKSNEKNANPALKNFRFIQDDQQILYKALENNLLNKKLRLIEQKMFDRNIKIKVSLKGKDQMRQFTILQLFELFKQRNQQQIKKNIIKGSITKIIRQFLQLYYRVYTLIIDDRTTNTFHLARQSNINNQNQQKMHFYSKSDCNRRLEFDDLSCIYNHLFENYERTPLNTQFSEQEKPLVEEKIVAPVIKKQRKQYFIEEQEIEEVLNIRDQIKKFAQVTLGIVNS